MGLWLRATDRLRDLESTESQTYALLVLLFLVIEFIHNSKNIEFWQP